jgi:hypothetical protein
LSPSDDPSLTNNSTPPNDDPRRDIEQRVSGLTGIDVPQVEAFAPPTQRVIVPLDNPLRGHVRVALAALNYTMEHINDIGPIVISTVSRLNTSDSQALVTSVESTLMAAIEMAYTLNALLDCRRFHDAYSMIKMGLCDTTLLPLFVVALLLGNPPPAPSSLRPFHVWLPNQRIGITSILLYVFHLLIPRSIPQQQLAHLPYTNGTTGNPT